MRGRIRLAVRTRFRNGTFDTITMVPTPPPLLFAKILLIQTTFLLSYGQINTIKNEYFPSVGLTEMSSMEFLKTTSPKVVLSSEFPSPELHFKFEQWKTKFGRAYKNVSEGALRKLIWLENHEIIETHNSRIPPASHTLAHNDFSDLSNNEFRQKYHLGEYSPGIVKPKGTSDGSWISSNRKLRRGDINDIVEFDMVDIAPVANVPEEKNWVEEGAVTEVKNQWFCGACWAFSAVGAIEGARWILSGNLTDLSMQQLIDCDMTDMGCGGGLMDQAFHYGEDVTGLCSLDDYPFAMHRHWFHGCARYLATCEPVPYSKVRQHVDIDQTEEALKAAIATQPVSVAVSAGGSSWQFYSGGTLDEICEGEVDHAILAVGYGHEDPSVDPGFNGDSESTPIPMDYWLVKNSWGVSWGLNGYMKIGRGLKNEASGGTSCILTLASRPILKKEN